MINESFFLIGILAGIPLAHIVLHSFLPFWRRHPKEFYAVSILVWVGTFAIAWLLSAIDHTVFTPPDWLYWSSLVIGFTSLILPISSISTLGVKRFLVWAVLRPSEVRQKHITKGPFQFIPHPAYTGYIIMSVSAFFATGKSVLLGFFIFMVIFTMIMIRLEERELTFRLGLNK